MLTLGLILTRPFLYGNLPYRGNHYDDRFRPSRPSPECSRQGAHQPRSRPSRRPDESRRFLAALDKPFKANMRLEKAMEDAAQLTR